MRVLVIGANGFMGQAISQELRTQHEVIAAGRYITHGVRIDLTDPQSISAALKSVQPDVIVNCAGIVENSEQAEGNPVMTRNLLDQVAASGLPIKRIIILGSAAEYGLVDKLPVNEDTPRWPVSPYGVSKKEEVDVALWFREEKHLPIVVVRVFNPIGSGMPPRTLLPGLMRQIAAFRIGETDHIEVGRLDAKRDYFDISDVGRAIGLFLKKTPKHAVYNLGSGVSTSNRQLVKIMLAESGMADQPKLIETSDTPEPLLACQADVSRIEEEFGWKPQKIVAEALADVTKVNVLIAGASETGRLLAENIARNKESAFNVVGFVDDNPTKQGGKVNSLPVLGAISSIRDIVIGKKVEEIFITIPSKRGSVVRQIVESTIGLNVEYKILPRPSKAQLQRVDQDYLEYIRKVLPEDLLGGEISEADQRGISESLKGQTIMITGAAGSIGSELSRQISAYGAKKIIFFDWWENGMFDLRNQILENYPDGDYEFIIGDIKDRRKLNQVMREFGPTNIFHAAAYKHVPLMEHNAVEAIKNNIIGTKNVAEMAIKYKVKKFLLVSTDKAVNPTNIMGATKRAAEKITHILADSQSDTSFSAVRFGNVINSNGSAIPFFQKQIARGGPVTVTHKDITRYFMTIPEAVHLILQAWVMGENKDLFALDLGEPVKIYDLARLLITLEGYTPDEDIKIKIIGLRPGEKLYEEVLIDEEDTTPTDIKKIFRVKNYLNFDQFAFLNKLNLLVDFSEEDGLNTPEIRDRLKQMISTYHPNEKE